MITRRTAVLAGVSTAVAATCLTAYALWRKRRRAQRIERRDRTILQLLEGETSPIMFGMATSISTVTYCEGDHARAAAYLRERVLQLVKLNPWVAGLLDQTSEDERPVLVYDPNPSDRDLDALMQRIFRHEDVGASSLAKGQTSFAELSKVVVPYLVKKGAESVRNREEFQFKVSVVPDAAAPNERWALVVSLSHVIGDGHTFYQLHNMLSDACEPRKLQPKRRPELVAAGGLAMCGEGGFLQTPKPGLLLSLIVSTIVGKIIGPACSSALFAVDERAVAAQKKAARAEKSVDFVSTNDVLTCSIFKAAGTSCGTMDVNFRSRVQEGGRSASDTTDGEELAGNYEDKIVYRSADFERPSLIRKSILSSDSLRRATQSRLPETLLEFWRLGMITSVSNWASFAKPLSLESCGSRAGLHVPVVDPADVPCRSFTGCFIYKTSMASGAAPLGLMTMGRGEVLQKIARLDIVEREIKL